MPCPICDEKPINCQCTKAERRMYYEIEELEEKVPRWIPVSERLPETPDIVLVYDGYIVMVGGYYEGEWSWADCDDACHPTHWLPIPPPPEKA